MDTNRKMPSTLTQDGSEAAERAHDAADTAWEKGLETWKDLSAQGKDAIAGAQKSAVEAWEDAQKLLQKHPGKAVGIALVLGTALGAAIGALWAFRHND